MLSSSWPYFCEGAGVNPNVLSVIAHQCQKSTLSTIHVAGH